MTSASRTSSSAPPEGGGRTPKQNLIGTLLILAVLGALGGLLYWRGSGFYRLDVAARVDHPDYRLLSPGQFVGHGYGIAGTLLILTNLVYLARRKLVAYRLGSMRAWLDMHVVTGLSGSLLVAFHSAFQFRTPVAVSTMAALGVVVTTGVIGRYIYSLTPRPAFERMEAHLDAFDAIGPGMGQAIRKELAAARTTELSRVTLIRALLTVPRWIVEARKRRAAVYRTAKRYEGRHLAELKLLRARIVDCANLAAGESRFTAASSLMRTWRGMHRLAAILMLLFVSLHIVVAWMMGYRWIWSE